MKSSKWKRRYGPVPISNTVDRFLATPSRRLVRLNVKVNEKTQIAGEKRAAKEGRSFGSSTVTDDGETRVVRVDKVTISCELKMGISCVGERRMTRTAEVNNEQINDKLYDLH
jgi:mannitol-specific phosphotransferase system IIBC component